MCNPAPGPRCAAHLKTSLAKNRERLKAAIASGNDADFLAADSERAALRFEYAGTRTGQQQLQTQIDRATDQSEKDSLTSLKVRARDAYNDKIDRLRREQAITATAAAPQPPRTDTSAVSYSGKGGKGGAVDRADQTGSAAKTCQHCGQDLPHTGTGYKESGACRRAEQTVTTPVSAASYSGKGGKSGTVDVDRQPHKAVATLRRSTPDRDGAQAAPTPESMSASSYHRKGGK